MVGVVDLTVQDSKIQTPFADKLHTNYVPQGSEFDEIHQVIAKPLREISQLTEKIAQLQATINDLSRRRDELSQFVEDHRALLSGIRRFPVELIQQIFSYCLPTTRNAVMSSDEAPVLLGRICKSWRQISLSTPQLWSSLHIPIPDYISLKDHDREKLLRRAETVKIWLDRSGCCPLSISLISDSITDPATNAESASATIHLLQTVIHYSMRWKNVHFSIPYTIYNSFLSNLGEANVPVLEKIRLWPFFRHPSPTMKQWLPLSMFQIPSLRQVNLVLPCKDYRANIFVLRWECITHLSLATQSGTGPGIPTWRALEFLKQCPKLISCKMGIESQPRTLTSITLPCLRSLEIIEGKPSATGFTAAFFEALSLPNLQHFKYSSMNRYQGNMVPFKSIITPSIESLELELTGVEKNVVISQYLPLLPSLKRLTLWDAPLYWPIDDPRNNNTMLDNKFLALLTPSADSTECLCPKLEEIRITCRIITDDALCGFLMARSHSQSKPLHPAIVPLKRAKISFERQRTIDIIPQLAPFMHEGLQVHLQYRSLISASGPFSPWRGLPLGKMELPHRQAEAQIMYPNDDDIEEQIE